MTLSSTSFATKLRGAMLIGSMLLGIAATPPALSAVPEYDVKAALIYKIAKFVHWPDRALNPQTGILKLCIVGRDDFGASIDSLNGKKLQGQVIVVERLQKPVETAATCQIAFIGRSERGRLPALLTGLLHSPVLTISDAEGFALSGGMIELSTVDSKISFAINSAASRRADLEISAQLLQLATLVGDAHPETKP